MDTKPSTVAAFILVGAGCGFLAGAGHEVASFVLSAATALGFIGFASGS